MTGQHQYEALKLAISDTIFGKSMDTVDDLMELVTAYAATVEREARIDELQRTRRYDDMDDNDEHVEVERLIVARLAALQGPQGKEQ